MEQVLNLRHDLSVFVHFEVHALRSLDSGVVRLVEEVEFAHNLGRWRRVEHLQLHLGIVLVDWGLLNLF